MANNKKFYSRNKHRSQKPPVQAVDDTVAISYTSEQLEMSLEQLGISESTRALLESKYIRSAMDLVCRTEKDLYKVQGFNKKMLFEVKDALRNHGMEIKQDAPAQKKQQGNSQTPAETAKPTQGSSKFGLADRQKPQESKPQQKGAKTGKPSGPLPVEEWHKFIKGGKWGFNDGIKVVIPAMYDDIYNFKEGLASVEIDGKCGYIDSQNNIVIPLDYDDAMSFSEGYAMVVKGDKCGYINKDNELVIPFEYDAATPFENGEAKVKKGGKWATLTKDGKLTWI